MIKKLLLFVLILLLPTSALASPVVFHIPNGGNAPYEPVTTVTSNMIQETEGFLTVDFIDRGAADCILLRCEDETMIVDGAAFNQYYKSIKSALVELDVQHINYMINTHAHNDHIEGLIAILRDDYMVDVYMSCYTDDYIDSKEHTEVRKLLTENDISYRRIGDGDEFMLGGATITVYRDETPGIDKNRHSIILKVVYGTCSVLLMADAGRETQDYLLDHYSKEVFKADVLKFAHHGMTTMSGTFLAAVSPELAVVTNICSSVPRAEKQLDVLQIPRYYTHAGVVHMQTDGHIWIVEQMEPDWPFNIT